MGLRLASLLLALLSLPTAARADGEAARVRATLQCEPAAAPGRVRCEAELRAREGTVRWADVQVVSTPDFIVPLRGRTGAREATTHEDDLWRWGLGFVAKDRGVGEMVVRLRAVVCAAGRCAPETTLARARVVVGR